MKTLSLIVALVTTLASHVLAADSPHVVFLIGEREYGTRTTLPEFAKTHLEPKGYTCTMVFAKSDERTEPGVHEFPGLAEALEDADLLVVSTRRRMPPQADMDLIKKWVADGKPVMGVRTASHAFAGRPKGEGYTTPEGHADWPAFDRDVFGCTYDGHFQNKPDANGVGTIVIIEPDHSAHPVLKGITLGEGDGVACTLYRSNDLAPDTTLLMTGKVPDSGETEPVTWVRESKQGRAFYTSLVSEPDMKLPWLQKLLANAVDWLVEKPEQ